ncbi:hypothetical protein [Largemouth bass virus]|uniref:Uncharacterized protein n=1 Tax=Largemouth bass virus TaxID=176656 RepID=A0A9E7PPC5_9VIRU|nr:hypothetical protein [Largemouth bass virus]WAK75087.1 hypothetical protein [Mandarin fish ranavirus]WHA35519.1 hypothetical protein MSRaV_31L [Micropterus salmoides ranavirus]WHA35624.1 hypothetical protein SCRaV_31L [Siniperca chuatsi ranavirus]WEI29056.1 hypothetical protein [Largemouth bass virus]
MTALKIVSIDVGIRHLAYCVIEGESIVRLRLYDAGSGLSGVKASEKILTRILMSDRGGGEWLDADIILIEAQHVKNVKAQLVAQTVRTWASINGIKWVQVPASLKLDKYVHGHSAMEYKTYKKKCADICEEVASEVWPGTDEAVWDESWVSAPKKDDMADCVLQAAAWVGKNS